MASGKNIKFLPHRNEALVRFYDAAANAPTGYNFFSPVSLDQWCTEMAQWLCEGNIVCEIGPGKGGLAAKTAKICSRILHYILVDISPAMLGKVKDELEKYDRTPISFDYIPGNIENSVPAGISRKSLDRIIAINVLQDVDILKSLRNIRAMLAPGGIFRATLISKEAQDAFWSNAADYDSESGTWYASSCYHEESCAEPMGFRLINGEKVPFYRTMKCYTKEEIRAFFSQCGFNVQRIDSIVYPCEYVLQRWSSKYHFMELTEEQKKLLGEWQGYPDGWSVHASADTI